MVEQGTAEQARMLLQRDEEQNRYPLLRLMQGGVSNIWLCGQSICLRDGEHDKYVYAVQRASELQKLLAEVRRRGGAQVSLLTDERWLDVVREMEPDVKVNHCIQLIAAPFQKIVPQPSGVTFGSVTPEVARWIATVYEHPELSEAFVMRRAKAAPNVVAFREGRPIGFFITHSDAELGPVYVDEDLRGSGLSDALYAQMLRQWTKNEMMPVLFVLQQNVASQKWLRRMDCMPVQRPMAWFWRE